MSGMSGMRGGAGTGDSIGRLSLPMVGLMVAAMMTPLIIPALRHAAARSLPRRRRRAIVLLIVTHVVVWLTTGIALQAVAARMLTLLGPVNAPATAIAVALTWETTPTGQRWANRHHAHPPLAAFGAAADRDLLSYGTRHAVGCAGACWAVMLVPALCGPYQFPAMALSALWVWAQALEPPAQPRWRFRLPSKAARLAHRSVRVHRPPATGGGVTGGLRVHASVRHRTL